MPWFRPASRMVEAEQWFPGAELPGVVLGPIASHALVQTRAEGWITLSAGDWLVWALGDSFPVVMSAEAFRDAYEAP